PFVCRCRDLRQGTGCEASGPLDEDGGRKTPRGFEGEAVFGVGGDRPQLAPARDRLLAAVPQLHEPVPLPSCAEGVDEPDELVDVATLDRDGNGVSHDSSTPSAGRCPRVPFRFGRLSPARGRGGPGVEKVGGAARRRGGGGRGERGRYRYGGGEP